MEVLPRYLPHIGLARHNPWVTLGVSPSYFPGMITRVGVEGNVDGTLPTRFVSERLLGYELETVRPLDGKLRFYAGKIRQMVDKVQHSTRVFCFTDGFSESTS